MCFGKNANISVNNNLECSPVNGTCKTTEDCCLSWPGVKCYAGICKQNQCAVDGIVCYYDWTCCSGYCHRSSVFDKCAPTIKLFDTKKMYKERERE